MNNSQRITRSTTPRAGHTKAPAHEALTRRRVGSGPERPSEPGEHDERVKAIVRARLFPRRHECVKIGRYTVLGRLGEGGMGIVYSAYDEELDRKIAIKVVRELDTRRGAEARARLQREAQAQARLAHPNIVAIHEVGLHNGEVYIAMEFVHGKPLAVWVEAPGRTWREVLDVYTKAGRGLKAAHDP